MKEDFILREKTKMKKLLEPKKSEESKLCCSIFDTIIRLVQIAQRMEDTFSASMSDLEIIEAQRMVIMRSIGIIEERLNLCNTFDDLQTESLKLKILKEDVIPNLRFYEIMSRLETISQGYDEIGQDLSYEETNQVVVDLARIENTLADIENIITAKLKNKLNSQS